MLDDQNQPIFLSLVLNAVESLQKCISADPRYPFSVDEILNIIDDDDDVIDYFQRIDPPASHRHTIHYRSSIINPIEQETPVRNDQNIVKPNEPSIDSTDDNDEISFNRLEWSIKDAAANKTRCPKLYEFLILLLNNPRYISYASWLNKTEGLFQIHQPDKVAKLWEIVKLRKSNIHMNFDKLTRAIREYYKDGLMVATYKKHTFRFVVNK